MTAGQLFVAAGVLVVVAGVAEFRAGSLRQVVGGVAARRWSAVGSVTVFLAVICVVAAVVS